MEGGTKIGEGMTGHTDHFFQFALISFSVLLSMSPFSPNNPLFE